MVRLKYKSAANTEIAMDMTRKSSSLTVPNDPGFISAVLDYGKSIAKRAGLNDLEVSELLVAINKACLNVVTYAFAPDDEEFYTIRFELLVGGIKVVIEDMGLPFSYNRKSDKTDSNGLHAIRNNVDKMVFINRGKKGKKLILTKYTSGSHASDLYSEAELKEYKSCDLPPGKVTYDIHILRPVEAEEVSRCIYMAYRYSYLKEDLYFPERIWSLNRLGQMVSAVATVEKSGGGVEVIAHFALLPAENKLVAEIGVAVVVPKYRGLGIMKAMLEFLIEYATENGFTALYGNAYSMHRFSQKNNLKFGFHETAIQLGRFPPSTINSMKEGGLKGSGHVITSFKFLSQGTPVKVYVPVRHKAIITEIYKELGANRIVETTAYTAPTTQQESAIKLTIKPSHLTATIFIEVAGRDIGERINAKRVELENQGINAIYVDFLLQNPGAPAAITEVESCGFCFAGLLPNYSTGDILRLQRYTTPVDYDELKTESRFAARLKEYIRELDPRYRALHPK